MKRNSLRCLKGLLAAIPLQGVALAMPSGAAKAADPFWEFKTLNGQFFTTAEEAAPVSMRAECEREDYDGCELLEYSETRSGYVFSFRYLLPGRPGDSDEDWRTLKSAGHAYFSCESNYALYANAFGQLVGPFANRTYEVNSPFTMQCSYSPDPQTATAFQSSLGDAQCSAEPGAMVGNPINAAASSKFQAVMDVPETAGSPLAWERFYNSGAVYDDSENGRPIGRTTPRNARLGSRWRSSYDRSLERTVMTTPEGFEEVARLYRHDGSRIDYVRRAGGYVSETDARGKLSRTSDGWTYRSNDGDVETYDEHGLLMRLRSQGSEDITFLYSDGSTPPTVAPEKGLLIRATDQRGRALSIVYDPIGRVTSVTDGQGNGATYAYLETDGKKLEADLSRVSYADGSSMEYRYNEREHTQGLSQPHLLTGIIDENGVRFATFGYDAQGHAVSTTHALGAEATFILNETDDKKTVRGPTGALHAYEFSKIRGSRRLVSVNQPGGAGCGAAFSKIEYDAGGHVSSTRDFDNALTRFVHDSDGKETERTEAADTPLARRIVTEWHKELGLPTRRARQGYEETIVYDERGNVVDRTIKGSVDPTDPKSPLTVVRRWHTTYNSDSKPLVIEGPRSDTGAMGALMTYTYHASDATDCAGDGPCSYRKGDLWTKKNASGHIEEILSYDKSGRVLSRKDANGVVTRYKYTHRGWLASTVSTDNEGLDRATTIDYTASGQVARLTDPDRVSLSFEYDAAQRLVGIVDANGNRLQYTLDAAGQRLSEAVKDSKASLVRQIERTYDALGRVESETDGLLRTTRFTYDELDRWTSTTDPAGIKTEASRDALGRLREVIGDSAGIRAAVTFSYDPLDQAATVTDPKHLDTKYLTSGVGDAAHVDSPDTGAEWNEFDVAGQLSSHEAPQAKGSFTTVRDSLGRVLSRAYAEGGDLVSYTYDGEGDMCNSKESYSLGRVSRMTDRSGTTTYCYNAEGQVTRRVWTDGGSSLVLAYQYTPAGRVAGLTYPDGTRIVLGHNIAGEVSAVEVSPAGGASQTLINAVTWMPFGGVAEWTYGSGRRLVRAFDESGRPVSVRDTQSGGLNYGLSYNESGLISGVDTATASRSFRYDGLNRLVGANDGKSGSTLYRYDYDTTGNRTAVHAGGGSDRYTYATDSHRLMASSGIQRTYDEAGNTATIGRMTLGYDAAARLASVSEGTLTRATYVYNGAGERSLRTEAGRAVKTLYDNQGRWLGDYDHAGRLISQAVWVEDYPVGLLAGGNVFYVEPDHLGTPRSVIDPKRGVSVWEWPIEGEAFGADSPMEDPDHDGKSFMLDLRFPGQRYDAASGLHYNYQRDYDPTSGRFVQSDPIGLLGGISTYAYVGSNPLAGFDSKGLRADTDLCAGLSAKACMHIGVVNTPDYASANVSWLSLSVGLTATGDTLYWNKAISKSWSENLKFNTTTIKSLLMPSISADIGFLNSNVGANCPAGEALATRRKAANDFVKGFSVATGLYYGPGASVVYSPSGASATQFGFGMGFGVTPGSESKEIPGASTRK